MKKIIGLILFIALCVSGQAQIIGNFKAIRLLNAVDSTQLTTNSNGTFYYNMQSNKFRFRENGAWRNLGLSSATPAVGQGLSIDFEDKVRLGNTDGTTNPLTQETYIRSLTGDPIIIDSYTNPDLTEGGYYHVSYQGVDFGLMNPIAGNITAGYNSLGIVNHVSSTMSITQRVGGLSSQVFHDEDNWSVNLPTSSLGLGSTTEMSAENIWIQPSNELRLYGGAFINISTTELRLNGNAPASPYTQFFRGDLTWGIPTTFPIMTTSDNPYTIGGTEYTILCDAALGAMAVQLLPASSVPGQVFIIKKIDSSVNAVTITPDATDEIDGDPTRVLGSEGESAMIQSNGTHWYVIGIK